MKLADAWTSVVSISVGDISAIRFFISFFFYSQKFHRSSAYILHFDSTWLAVCLPPPHSHCKVSYPGTPHSCRNAPRPIFSVLICVINDVIDLLILLWIFSILAEGAGWIILKALPVFLFSQSAFHSLLAVCLILVLITVTNVLPAGFFHRSAILSVSIYISFPFRFLIFRHPVASLATLSTRSLPSILSWAGIIED